MVQLTLVEHSGACGLAEQIDALVPQWTSRLGHGAHATAAAGICARHFAEWASRPLDRRERERVAAYFGAVVRRRVIRGQDHESVEARRRLVVASIEADLLSAGWDAPRATVEALRATGARSEYGRTA